MVAKSEIDLTVLKIDGVGTVLKGVEKIFARAKEMDFGSDEQLAQFLFDGIKVSNAIAKADEQKIKDGLLRKYKKFNAGEKEDDDKAPVVDVKILGGCCPNCLELEKQAMAAVIESGVEGPFLTVSDPEKIAEFGMITTPALVINGKVVSKGRVLGKEQIKKLIRKAIAK